MNKHVPSWYDDEVGAVHELASDFFEREVMGHARSGTRSAASTARCG